MRTLKFWMRIGMLSMAAAGPLKALTIQVDYRLDSSGFFTQPEARAAIEAVADFFGEILHDSLEALVPSGNNTWNPRFFHPVTGADVTPTQLKDLVVPADTLIVFVGARALSPSSLGIGGPGGYTVSGTSAWVNTVGKRGQSGATGKATTATDVGPWGGSISFNSAAPWNFSLEGRPLNSNADFVSVALHEMCHLLGFGTAYSFQRMVSGLVFTGPTSKEVWGGNVPLNADGGHWRDDGKCAWPLGYDPANPNNVLSRTYGSFGRGHGLDQIALMDPFSCILANRDFMQVLTDLDLAGLKDIGWEVEMPVKLEMVEWSQARMEFAWPTTSGMRYTLQRSTNLENWLAVKGPSAGNGRMDGMEVIPDPGETAFYRLKAESDGHAPPLVERPAPGAGDQMVEAILAPPEPPICRFHVATQEAPESGH